jgi:16S rRNA processing protein RimM
MQTQASELLRLGVVMGTHGLRGDLKIRPQAPDAHALLEAKRIFLRRAGESAVAYRPVRALAHKGVLLIRLEGLDHIDAVQPLVGAEVLIRRADLAQPPEGEVYWLDLQGVTVSDRTYGELGTLDDLFTTAAHDVYVVNGPYGEVLIPVVEEFIVEVDTAGRRMLVDLPDGLVPKPDEV